MSDSTASARRPTDEGLLKRIWWAVNAEKNLWDRVMLSPILRWVAILALISFIGLIGFTIWRAVDWSEKRDQFETLRQEKATDGAQHKSDIADLKSEIAAKKNVFLQAKADHEKQVVDLKKHSAGLRQRVKILDEALRKKSTCPTHKQLKADLNQSLTRNMVLQQQMERHNATPMAKKNASLQSQADEDGRKLRRFTRKLNASNQKAGQLRATLQEERGTLRDVRLEMKMLIAREGVGQWGESVPFTLAYYKCKARSGDIVKLIRLGRRKGAELSISLFPGDGSRRGLFITRRTYYLPSGLYDIEIRKNGKRVSISKYPAYLSPRPRQKYIVCPDGNRIPIPHQGRNNIILLSPESYRLSTIPRYR